MSDTVVIRTQWIRQVLGVDIAGRSPGTDQPPQTTATPPSGATTPSTAASTTTAATAKAPDTPDQKKYKDAYERIKRAEAKLSNAAAGSEVGKLAAGFKAIPMPPDPASVIDFAKALADAKAKLDTIENLQAADDYDDTAAREMPVIRKAGLYIAQSGAMKGLEKAKDEIAALAKKAADQVKKSDYETAMVLLTEAGSRARAVKVPYDTLIDAEQNKPLFARAEKLLEQKKLPPDLKADKDTYKQAAKDHAAALKTADYAKWKSTFTAKRDLANQIVAKGQTAQVDDWFNGRQALPAGGASATPGIATGLSTMPDLSQMSEADKFSAMAKQWGSSTGNLEKTVTGLYARALRDGKKLDLTPAQIAAAAGYSGTNYTNMNGLLRGSLDTTKLKPEALDLLKVQIDLLCQALEKLPDYEPAGFPLFRWETPYGDYLQSRYQVKSPVFEIKEFWSTGAGGGSAVGASPSTEILIWGKKKSKAKAIDMLSLFGGSEGSRADGTRLKGQGSGEVLFPPGTKFKTRVFHAFDRNNKEVFLRADSKDQRLVDFHYRVEIEEV